jgi:hypothetical protein
MEEIQRDLEWLIYEGNVISQDYITMVIQVEDLEKQKEIIDKIFNKTVLKQFYVLCQTIDNIYMYVEIKEDFPYPFTDYLMSKYRESKKNLNDMDYIGDIRKFVLYFDNYISSYENVIKSLIK